MRSNRYHRRRQWVTTGLWLLTQASDALALNQVDQLSVTRRRLGLRHLPPEFEGFRIAQLSDIHHSETYSDEQVARAVAETNRLAPDLVVLTGDYITSTRRYVPRVTELLGGFTAPEGTYAVLGNHDFWVDGEWIAGGLRRHGVEVLRNAHTRLRRGGAALQLLGVDDLWVRRSDLGRAAAHTRPDEPRILLSHNPEVLPEAAARGIDLVLAGHTHGGQVALPVIGAPHMNSYYRGKTLAGHAVESGTQIYVNRGLGTVFAPVRLHCPPEITVLELYRAE
jgi:predicted MPP superfamily phosphohydrolase